MAAFLAGCLTIALGALGMIVALPLAEARRSRNRSSSFWRSYLALFVSPLACALVGVLWATQLNGMSDADRYAIWPPVSGVLVGIIVALGVRWLQQPPDGG